LYLPAAIFRKMELVFGPFDSLVAHPSVLYCLVAHPSVLYCLVAHPAVLHSPWWPTHPSSDGWGYRLDVQGSFSPCFNYARSHPFQEKWVGHHAAFIYRQPFSGKMGGPPRGLYLPAAIFRKMELVFGPFDRDCAASLFQVLLYPVAYKMLLYPVAYKMAEGSTTSIS
ncbi:MAG: hypothetical protein JRJ79_18370, partial [Deltaproteobacteria bacterium]|nr:hypothetical protein [Deltaproteobacteria bacterium]